MPQLRVIQGGKAQTKVYKGLRGPDKMSQIIASTSDEAYALFLDSEYGNDTAGLSVEIEDEKLVLRQYRNMPVGVY